MAEVIARVGRITGEAVARDPDGNVRRLKSGDPIREGDVVQAADGAQVVLRLADGRDLTVNANEAARIDAEVAAPDLPDAGDSAVQNNPRGFLKVAKAIVGADGTFSFGDDAGQVRNAADQKDGHTFIELVRIVENVEPLSFQFATTRFPLNDTIEGGPTALFDALNAATAASLTSRPTGVPLAGGQTATAGGQTTTATVTLGETNVNDNAPAFGAPSYSFSYPENSLETAVLGTVSASDADGDAVVYSITGGNGNGWFEIDSATGAISLTVAGAAAAANDFEGAPNSHSLTVTATAGGQTTTATVTLGETNVNEAPVASGGQVNGTEDTNHVFSWANFNVSDVDTAVGSLGVKISTLPTDGTLQYSTNGTTWTAVAANQLISKATIDNGWLRFVPDNNESGADVFGGSGIGNRQADYARFTYTPNDGLLDGAVATMRIDIAPDADTPTLSFGALVYTATSITSVNATTTNNGFNMLAFNPNGSAGAISLKTGSPDGFGVLGAASGDTTELGYSVAAGASERLVVNLDNLVSSVDVSFAWLAAGERYSD